MMRACRSGGTLARVPMKKGMFPKGSSTRKSSTAAEKIVTSSPFPEILLARFDRGPASTRSHPQSGHDFRVFNKSRMRSYPF